MVYAVTIHINRYNKADLRPRTRSELVALASVDFVQSDQLLGGRLRSWHTGKPLLQVLARLLLIHQLIIAHQGMTACYLPHHTAKPAS